MATLVYAPAAITDIDGIWDYTVANWGETQAATYVRAIAAACNAIADGERPSRAIDDIRPGYRKVLVKSHVIFFRGTGETTEIIRILHQQMDVSRHLEG